MDAHDPEQEPDRWREHARLCVETMDWPADFPGPDDSPPGLRSRVCVDGLGAQLWVDSVVLAGRDSTFARVLRFDEDSGGVLLSFAGELEPQLVPAAACARVLP